MFQNSMYVLTLIGDLSMLLCTLKKIQIICSISSASKTMTHYSEQEKLVRNCSKLIISRAQCFV